MSDLKKFRKKRTVAQGDTLSKIAMEEYGSANAWRQIAEANNIADPKDLKPGMVLEIPLKEEGMSSLDGDVPV